MSNKILAGLGVLVVVGLVWFFTQRNATPQPPTPSPTPAATQTPTPVPPKPTEIASVEVIISDSGFSPKDVTVKKGSTVTFVNNSTRVRWPASAPHPTHTDYPGFDPKGPVASVSSWSFTFDQVGVWKYHDHLQPSLFGSITVVE